jgi:glucosamine kinase
MGGTVPTALAVVDGGATGCRVRLYDGARALLAEATGGPASLTLGVEQAWRNVEAALREAMGRAASPITEPHALHLAAGLAGARSPENRAAFRAGDPFGCRSITIVTDGYASLLGALEGTPGTALAIGTGVTAYALRADGSVAETGGWGFPAGDEGGGAWIGWRGVQALTKWRDGRTTEESQVFPALAARIGPGFDEIQKWLRSARSTEFASLAPLVVAAADRGDALAERILQDAAAEHALAIVALDLPGEAAPVTLLGGLAPVFAPRLAEPIRARIVPPKGDALSGLLGILTDGLARQHAAQ